MHVTYQKGRIAYCKGFSSRGRPAGAGGVLIAPRLVVLVVLLVVGGGARGIWELELELVVAGGE